MAIVFLHLLIFKISAPFEDCKIHILLNVQVLLARFKEKKFPYLPVLAKEGLKGITSEKTNI